MRTLRISLLVLLSLSLAIPSISLGVEEGFLETEPGIEIHWRELGEGPPLIIPGDFLLGEDFEFLARSHRVIFYDMRNRGRSSTLTDPTLLTIEGDVRDLEAIRAHFGIDRFSTIGYSYLGKMVLLYALQHPDRIDRIVQIGPVPMRFGSAMPVALDNTTERVFDRAAVNRLRSLRADGFHEHSPREYCEKEWLVTRVGLVGDPALAEGLDSRCELPNEWPTRLAFHLEHAFPSAQRADVGAIEISSLQHPVLTIHGTLDRNAPYGGGVEWAAMLPDGRLRTVEGAAHQVWLDDPSVLTDIESFLGGTWPPRARSTSIVDHDALSQLRGVDLLRRARARLVAGAVPETFYLVLSGDLFVRSQSRSASPPWDRFQFQSEIVITDGGASVAVDESFHWPNFVSRHRIVRQPAGSFQLDLNREQIVEPYRPPVESWRRALQFSPFHLLGEALESPQPIRHLGVDRTGPQPVQLVAVDIAGERVTLVVDDEDRIVSIRRIHYDPVTGDQLETIELEGEHAIQGVIAPRAVHRAVNGVPSASFEVSAGTIPERSRFEIPEDFTRAGERQSGPVLENLASGVWIVRNVGGADYNTIVVVHDDGLVFLETPQNEDAMHEAIEMARRSLGDLPVKAAVVSHHHFDHAGGVRAAMAAGAKIYVPPGTEELFLEIATAPRASRPVQVEPIDVRSLQLEVVDDGTLVSSSGSGPEVRLFTVGDNEHADEIVFAWIPEHRILFQGDLFVKYGDEPEPARAQGIIFHRRVVELGLDPERIIGVHGRTATMDDLARAVAASEDRR